MPDRMWRKISRPLWLLIAALFLFEAWLWDVLGSALTRFAELPPFKLAKQALTQEFARLPAGVVLVIFLTPLSLIEPLKALAVWLAATGHVLLGTSMFIGAQIGGVGVTAFLFEISREKLLSIDWFERLYQRVMQIRAWADAALEPFKQRIRDHLAPFRQRLRVAISTPERRRGLGRRLGLLRLRARRSRGVV